jgi:hypothetical protein
MLTAFPRKSSKAGKNVLLVWPFLKNKCPLDLRRTNFTNFTILINNKTSAID